MMTDNEWQAITAKRDALAEMLERQRKTPSREADQLMHVWDHYRDNGLLPGNTDFLALYQEALTLRQRCDMLQHALNDALLDLGEREARIADLEDTMDAVREVPDVAVDR